MKKIYMTMAAMLCGVAAMAQATLTGPEKLEMAQDGEVDVTIGLQLESATTAMSFRIAGPAGTALATHKETVFNEITFMDEEIDVVNSVLNAAYVQDHTATIQPVVEPEDAAKGFTQVAVTSLSKKVFKGLKGDVITLTLKGDGTAEPGEYAVVLKKASISSTAGVSLPITDGITIPLTITKGTGINSINADDVNAPIYNIAGQRVSKAQKGVFIQNGKKIAVK